MLILKYRQSLVYKSLDLYSFARVSNPYTSVDFGSPDICWANSNIA